VKGKLIFSPKRGFPARIPRSLTEKYCGETVPIPEIHYSFGKNPIILCC